MAGQFNTRDHQDIIRRPIISEKGYDENELGKYRFVVHTKATKIDVRNAVEKIYKVKVTSVNVLNRRGKKRRMRAKEGRTADWRQAIVTLREGDHIDFFEKV